MSTLKKVSKKHPCKVCDGKEGGGVSIVFQKILLNRLTLLHRNLLKLCRFFSPLLNRPIEQGLHKNVFMVIIVGVNNDFWPEPVFSPVAILLKPIPIIMILKNILVKSQLNWTVCKHRKKPTKFLKIFIEAGKHSQFKFFEKRCLPTPSFLRRRKLHTGI